MQKVKRFKPAELQQLFGAFESRKSGWWTSSHVDVYIGIQDGSQKIYCKIIYCRSNSRLLKNGIDINVKDSNGDTVVQLNESNHPNFHRAIYPTLWNYWARKVLKLLSASFVRNILTKKSWCSKPVQFFITKNGFDIGAQNKVQEWVNIVELLAYLIVLRIRILEPRLQREFPWYYQEIEISDHYWKYWKCIKSCVINCDIQI